MLLQVTVILKLVQFCVSYWHFHSCQNNKYLNTFFGHIFQLTLAAKFFPCKGNQSYHYDTDKNNSCDNSNFWWVSKSCEREKTFVDSFDGEFSSRRPKCICHFTFIRATKVEYFFFWNLVELEWHIWVSKNPPTTLKFLWKNRKTNNLTPVEVSYDINFLRVKIWTNWNLTTWEVSNYQNFPVKRVCSVLRTDFSKLYRSNRTFSEKLSLELNCWMQKSVRC